MNESTDPLSLTDFLLARLAEDEALATRDVLRDPLDCPVCGAMVEEFIRPAIFRGRKPTTRPDRCEPCGHALTVDQSAACFVPHISSRMAAEIEAKRRIVSHMQIVAGIVGPRGDDARAVLTWLALPYADHPDFREEWKS